MKIFSLTDLRRFVTQTPTLLTIAVGLGFVIYQQAAGPLPIAVQLIFCGFLLVFAGIPHGALDHLVEQERATRLGKRFSLLKFLAKYLLTMGVYAGAWLLAPVPCLLVFLLISAWHFGETDLETAPETPYGSLARLSAGGFVLAFILLTHADETTPILSRIVQADNLAMAVWAGAVSRLGAILRGWATLTLVLTMLAYGQRPALIDGWRLARLLVVVWLTYYLPLLPAFMLYFGGWHALSSFRSLRDYLPVNTKNPTEAAWQVWQQSLPLTGVAFGFLGICAVGWYYTAPNLDPIPILFILLSLITLPHIGVMHTMHTK
jgi:beta-carotene 15,15'-dioxygenase